MALIITHSKWVSLDRFEALGFDDAHPNMVIQFDYTPQIGWQKWEHDGWLRITVQEVPPYLMVRCVASKPQKEREKPGRKTLVFDRLL